MSQAIVLTQAQGNVHAAIRRIDDAELPPADTTLRIEFSSLNYKDALAITRGDPVVRAWPMVPGIDGAGVVERSQHPTLRVGDRVILNGWGVGEKHWGCLAQKASVMGDWLVPLPPGLDIRSAMALGTAGYTAMLCVMKLEDLGVRPSDGEVLVTGAAGGVGSVAISLLAGRGFQVVASTGRSQEAAYLKALGAADVIDRASLSSPGKPLGRERWAGVVDSVGSHTLANACATTRPGGVVAACGLAQGMDLSQTVAPFILRGVTLAGVDSVMAPRELRLRAWSRLADEMDRALLASLSQTIGLRDAIGLAPQLLAGKVRGRVVVNVHE